jgi:hypothetical protein
MQPMKRINIYPRSWIFFNFGGEGCEDEILPIKFLKFSMHSTTMFLIGPQFISNPLPKVLPFSLIKEEPRGRHFILTQKLLF